MKNTPNGIDGRLETSRESGSVNAKTLSLLRAPERTSLQNGARRTDSLTSHTEQVQVPGRRQSSLPAQRVGAAPLAPRPALAIAVLPAVTAPGLSRRLYLCWQEGFTCAHLTADMGLPPCVFCRPNRTRQEDPASICACFLWGAFEIAAL